MENPWWKENICSIGSELTLCANTKEQSSSQMEDLLPAAPQALFDCSSSQPHSPELLMGSAEPPWNKRLCSLNQDLAWTRIETGNLFI